MFVSLVHLEFDVLSGLEGTELAAHDHRRLCRLGGEEGVDEMLILWAHSATPAGGKLKVHKDKEHRGLEGCLVIKRMLKIGQKPGGLLGWWSLSLLCEEVCELLHGAGQHVGPARHPGLPLGPARGGLAAGQGGRWGGRGGGGRGAPQSGG